MPTEGTCEYVLMGEGMVSAKFARAGGGGGRNTSLAAGNQPVAVSKWGQNVGNCRNKVNRGGSGETPASATRWNPWGLVARVRGGSVHNCRLALHVNNPTPKAYAPPFAHQSLYNVKQPANGIRRTTLFRNRGQANQRAAPGPGNWAECFQRQG